MTRNQTFKLIMTFLVLVFLAFIALITRSTPQQEPLHFTTTVTIQDPNAPNKTFTQGEVAIKINNIKKVSSLKYGEAIFEDIPLKYKNKEAMISIKSIDKYYHNINKKI